MFKNVKKEEITIPAQMSYLIQVRDFIDHIGKRYRFEEKIVNSFKLVVDEACTNIIRHGYRDIKNGEITIKAIVRRLSLTILIVDQGKSFDPRQAATPDLAKYVNIGKKGGLGIMMMRKLMDDMSYSVTERGNEFRLTKYRDQSHESKVMLWWHGLNLKAKYSIFASVIFTVLVLAIFIPIYMNTNEKVLVDALSVTGAACQAMADNSVDDLLNDNSAVLFENAYSFRNSDSLLIKDVFVVDTAGAILAWGNTSRTYEFSTYPKPGNAALVDTFKNARVFSYALNDTVKIYDVSAEITLGGVKKIGEVHAWIDQQTIVDRVNHKKLRQIIFLIIILVAGYIPLVYLINRILSPFHSLAEWVREVIHGKVDQDEIDIDASDEIGEIAQAFNEMTSKFREAQVNLMEQQKLQKELQVAQEIQQMLLPSDFPKVEGFEIASYYEAAKEVGGDLFDFVEVDDETIGICVADVSGKGVPGSLIMTMIRTALRLESRGNKNPADVLARVNRFVADDMKRGMFVTMFYIILDSRNRIIHYASAGHNPMILYRGSSRQTYYLNPTGFPVGIQLPDLHLFDKTIQTDSIRLREDDILVLYTDGITEAMNAKRELFREERFLETIRRNAHLDVGEFVKSVNQDLKAFTGGAPQNDDITFVAVKERMMAGDVKYRLQEELFNMIEEGVKVKDALEKLKVSPHQYYKYKEIIQRKGMKGLRDYFEEQDYVEKKHLSIEAKTKIFDIIRKHPDYGPKLISYELRKDEYGNMRIDADRIYNELIKLRLNTQTLRERYLRKSSKRPLKQPGTPLLTLDGKVILDFESSEREIAKRHEVEAKAMRAIKPEETEERKPTTIHLTTTEAEEELSGKFMHQAATMPPEKEKRSAAQPEPEVKEKAADSKPDVKPKTEPKAKPKPRAVPAAPKPQAEPEMKAEPAQPEEKGTPQIREDHPPEKEVSRKDLLQSVTADLNKDDILHYFDLVKDDFTKIRTIIGNIEESEHLKQDIKTLNVLLKISLKHPHLKKIPDVKGLFEQIQHIFDITYKDFEHIDAKVIYINYKELLKYFKKDNKFKDYSSLFENINTIGLIHRHIQRSVSEHSKGKTDSYKQIREKLASKKVISNTALLEAIEKNKEQ